MGDFLGSYYTLDAPSSKLALLRAEQPVSVMAMDAIHPTLTSPTTAHRATTHARWHALERLHTRDIHPDALVPQLDMVNLGSMDSMLIEKAAEMETEADADVDMGELDIPVASMSLFEPGTGLITLPLSRACISGRGGYHAEEVRRVPCAPGDSPMPPKVQRVYDTAMDDDVPGQVPVPDFAKARAAALKSASLRSSLMRFIGRRGLK